MALNAELIRDEILKGNLDQVDAIISDSQNIDDLLLRTELFHEMGLFHKQYNLASSLCDHPSINKAQYFQARYWMAWAKFRLGQHDEALQIGTETLQNLEKLPESVLTSLKKERGLLLNIIGTYYLEVGLYEEGIKYLEDSYEYIKHAKDLPSLVKAYNNLAYGYQQSGYLENAKNDYDTALRLIGDNDYPSLLGLIYSNLGEVYRLMGDYSEAYNYHILALENKEKVGNQFSLANQLRYLGVLKLEMGEVQEAEMYINRSMELYKSTLDNPLWYSATLFEQSRILLKLNQEVDIPLKIMKDLYNKSKNKIILQRFMLIRAKQLAKSPRMRLKSRAQRILQSIYQNMAVDFEVTYLAMVEYLNLLFDELKLSYDDSIIDDAIDIAHQILRVVQENHFFTRRIEFYLILSRLHILKWDLKRALGYFNQADLLLVEHFSDPLEGSLIADNVERERTMLEQAQIMYNAGLDVSIKERINTFWIETL
ncbi:MAG: tetratricopeptide repeat protein [Candidatus Heimdallarchaeota archaeon]|nr:tetratricopeptide repeat protein [Candidatus Heimdallarchaeota archaeon]